MFSIAETATDYISTVLADAEEHNQIATEHFEIANAAHRRMQEYAAEAKRTRSTLCIARAEVEKERVKRNLEIANAAKAVVDLKRDIVNYHLENE